MKKTQRIVENYTQYYKLNKNSISYYDIEIGDKVQYIIPGTTTEIKEGKVVDKISSRNEDFVVIWDKEKHKKLNIQFSHITNIFKIN